MKQRVRDFMLGPLTIDYFMQRAAEGWKLTHIEWEREMPIEGVASQSSTLLVHDEDVRVPYGFRIAGEASTLEEDPGEAAVLFVMLEQITQEKRITEIARQLNESGYTTRTGEAWTASAVFNLLPRVVEVAPAVFKSALWIGRRGADRKPN